MTFSNIGNGILLPSAKECLSLFLDSPYFLDTVSCTMFLGYENTEQPFRHQGSEYYFINSNEDLKKFLDNTQRYRTLIRKPVYKQLLSFDEKQEIVNFYDKILHPQLQLYILNILFLVNMEVIQSCEESKLLYQQYTDYVQEVSLLLKAKFNDPSFIKMLWKTGQKDLCSAA